MKFEIFIKSVTCILILLSSCSNRSLPSTYVNYIGGGNGLITVRSIGVGKNLDDVIENAEENSIKVLLFRGIPQSEQKLPLVGTNESEIIEKHQNYFNKFFEQKRYKTFIMSSVKTSDLVNHKNNLKSLSLDITINLKALRQDLETNGIIQKFGF